MRAFRTLQDDPAAARRHPDRGGRPHLLCGLGPQGRRIGRRGARHRFRPRRLCRPDRFLGPLQADHRRRQRPRHRGRVRARFGRRHDGGRGPCRVRPVGGHCRPRRRCRRHPAPAPPHPAWRSPPSFCLTGRRFTAREAKAWGLANAVVPQAELMAAARDMADRIVAAAPLSVAAVKDILRRHGGDVGSRGLRACGVGQGGLPPRHAGFRRCARGRQGVRREARPPVERRIGR